MEMSLPIGLVALGLGVFCAAFIMLVRSKPGTPQRSLASKVKQLRRVPFLEGLADDDITRIAKIVRELHVPADAFVVRENRVGEAMYLVLSGALQILKRGTHEQTLVQTIGPGEIVGEMALLTGARRIASARSISPCILMQVMRDDFHELLALQPEVTTAVWSACEAHSIDLALRDHERTRAMTLGERTTWIEKRATEVVTDDREQLAAPKDGYMAVIAGTFVHDGREHHGPDLVRVCAGDKVEVRELGRVCWLDDPPHQAAA